MLVGWVGDCAIVVWCVVWVGLFALCFGAWLGKSCCAIACVRFLLASFVLVRVSCSCVGVCLPFVCSLCFVVCWLVGWVWIWFWDLVGQELRSKQIRWNSPCKCCVDSCVCVWRSCVFVSFFIVCLACVVSCDG